ncbi:MAG: 3-isopropylmalate dehydrogenase [Clostridiales bacterium]|nr:3-isopropylmalate dehydrogenase [Clostridiales bacterium]
MENTKKIAVIKGDGIGPEITEQAIRVLDKVAEKYGHSFTYTRVMMGGESIDAFGVPLTDEAVAIAKSCDAVLLGAVGGAADCEWNKLPGHLRPEAGLLKIRKELGVFANLRPAVLYKELKNACPLRVDIVGDGFDLLIVRELTGGLYFGERHSYEENGLRKATDTCSYDENEVRRIAIKAFEAARKRSKRLCSVDKANVLDTSRLWRKVVIEVSKDYPDIELSHMLVDNCAMQLVRDPKQFDVVLTENMFGDILSDEASMVAGSIGLLSSASLGEGKLGLYEPSHGSAPDIAGKDLANPLATIISAGMLLRYSFDMEKEADAVDNAVKSVLANGYRTSDIYTGIEGTKKVSCSQMGDKVIDFLR